MMFNKRWPLFAAVLLLSSSAMLEAQQIPRMAQMGRHPRFEHFG